jgi:hypothetical protein
MQSKEGIDLANFVLPIGVLDYFTITNINQTEEDLCIYLDENNIIPQEYKNDKVISKGFYEESRIQDFPIRGKAVYLYVRRRRWFNETIGEYICRDWTLVANGTRMTQEFASFLKVISRYQANKL